MSTTDKATLEEVRQALRKCGYRNDMNGKGWYHLTTGSIQWDADDFLADCNAIHELIDAACARFKLLFEFSQYYDEQQNWLVRVMEPKGHYTKELTVTHSDDFATAVIRAINQIPEVEG